MIWDNIPEELKKDGLWCCWRLTEKGKIPINALTGGLAKSNNKNTFHSYDLVMEKIHNYYDFNDENKITGGLGLGVFNGFSAIDIDHCRDTKTGKLTDLANDIINFCGSYTEISPSGEGIRIIFKTNTMLDKEKYYINNRNNGLEIYISDNTNKFVTITGNVLYPADLKTIDITYILDKYMKKNQTDTNDNLERALRKDKKLMELWNAKASGSGGNESEIDLALCNKLAFYLKGDYDMINNAFVSSPYFATKDDTHRKKWLIRKDYRDSTIKMATNSIDFFNTVRSDEFELNDTGNAHRFVNKFRENIKYNVNNKMWITYNGRYWQHDVFNNIKNLAEIVVEDMKQEALIIESDEFKKAIMKNAKRALSSSGKTAMLKEAEHITGIPCLNSDFDKDPFLFNCASGVIDLKTGQVLEHDRNLMLSKYSDIEISYEKPTKWLKFLNEIFNNDEELIHYVHKILGYSMTGSTKEQCMFIFLGDGSNGKSILLEIINRVMGSYGATTNVEVLLEKKNQTGNFSEVARLNGIRNVVTSETQIGDKLNEAAIKSMTSGIGKIVARFLYGNEFEFTPIFKIFMDTNHKPTIRGTDNGIWRRIRVIPFNVIIPDEKQDKNLIYKLCDELPQILNWLVEGCLLWQKEGLFPPKIISDTIKDYRSEMDLVQRWIDECCEVDINARESSTLLFQNLCDYTQANKEYQLSNTLFGRNMGKKFEKKRISGVVYYLGIRIKDRNWRFKDV